jgi:hypothetical protein
MEIGEVDLFKTIPLRLDYKVKIRYNIAIF